MRRVTFRIKLLTIITLWLLTYCCFAETLPAPIKLSQIGDQLLGKQISYYQDTRQNLSFQEIYRQRDSLPWERSQDETPSKGFTRIPYWFYLTVENDHDKSRNRLLEFDFATLDDIEVCYLARGADPLTARCQTAGDRHPFAKRPVPTLQAAFPITFAPQAVTDIYIKVVTASAMQLPARLWQIKEFNRHIQTHGLVLGLILGFAIGIGAYSLFLFRCTGENLYLYYTGALIACTLTVSTFFGLSFQYVWPNQSEWNECLAKANVPITTLMIILFIKRYLQRYLHFGDNHPTFTLLLNLQLLSGSILALLSLTITYSVALNQYSVINTSLMAVTLILIGVYLIIKKFYHAWFFLCSIACLIIPVLLTGLHRLALIPHLPLDNFITLGLAAMFVMFSLSITRQITQNREEKIQLQQQSILHLKRYRDLYDTALEGLFCTLPNGLLVQGNGILEKILDFSFNTSHKQPVYLQDYFEHSRQTWGEVIATLDTQNQVINLELPGKPSGEEQIWYSLSARYTHTAEGEFIEGSLVNISERKHHEARLSYLAAHDTLTALLNRNEFEQRLERARFSAHSHNNEHAVLFVDLDQFKVINDTCGHQAGDECLRQLAGLLRSLVRQRDSIARVGGDEFGILLENCIEPDAAELAQQICTAIESYRFAWDGQVFRVSASIGVAVLNTLSESIAAVLSLADTACYAAKDAGRNRIMVCHPETLAIHERRTEMHMVSTIVEALRKNQLQLYRQAIMPLSKPQHAPRHYEILVRLEEGNKLLLPATFLPAAQRYHLMPKLDRWIITNALAWLRQPENLATIDLLNINLNPQSLDDPEFLNFFHRSLQDYAVPAHKLCFEITEYTAIHNMQRVQSMLQALRNTGVAIAIDDFGSGFASFDYLKRLPADYIKIDGHFIDHMITNPTDCAMVEAMASIAHTMDKVVIAESVEDADTVEKLRALGIDYGQGFYWDQPKALPLAVKNDLEILIA